MVYIELKRIKQERIDALARRLLTHGGATRDLEVLAAVTRLAGSEDEVTIIGSVIRFSPPRSYTVA